MKAAVVLGVAFAASGVLLQAEVLVAR